MNHAFLTKACYEYHALLNGLRFFTRIRVPDRIPHSEALLNHAARYFPVIGLIVGGFSAAAFNISHLVFSQSVSVLIAMAISIYLTGAFHEDGLSDMADGLGGGWDKHRILEIMKDSRVGNYGVIAITMILLTKFASLSEVRASWVPMLLITGHAFSRYCAVLVMAGMNYVRDDASSKAKPLATRTSGKGLIVASAFGLIPLFWLPFPAMIIGYTAGMMSTIWLGRKLQKWLGGYTGDCLGAVQQLSEVAFYLAALATLH